MKKAAETWDTTHDLRDRKWQIGDSARLGPSYVAGPSPRPSTSGPSPWGLKGQHFARLQAMASPLHRPRHGWVPAHSLASLPLRKQFPVSLVSRSKRRRTLVGQLLRECQSAGFRKEKPMPFYISECKLADGLAPGLDPPKGDCDFLSVFSSQTERRADSRARVPAATARTDLGERRVAPGLRNC